MQKCGYLNLDPAMKKWQRPKAGKISIGAVDINRPRDHNGTFESEIILKRHKTLGVDLNQQTIGLYALGASYSDIRVH